MSEPEGVDQESAGQQVVAPQEPAAQTANTVTRRSLPLGAARAVATSQEVKSAATAGGMIGGAVLLLEGLIKGIKWLGIKGGNPAGEAKPYQPAAQNATKVPEASSAAQAKPATQANPVR